MEVSPGRPHGGYHVEHFRPEHPFKNLRNSYGNLYWACPDCNGAKSDTWPLSTEEVLGYRFLDPCEDCFSDHLAIVGTEVKALSRAGQYTIDVLDLNSPIHIYRRQRRQKALKRVSLLETLIEHYQQSGERVAPQWVDEVSDLREAFLPSLPKDAPTSCLCDEPRTHRRSR